MNGYEKEFMTLFKNNEIVLLLIGGDKSSQTKDIEKAKQFLEDLE